MRHSTVPTSVYQYRDRWGTLIYVGVTSRQTTRQGEHVRSKEWWPLVDGQTVEHYSTREEALARETELIHRHTPPFNTSQNPHAGPMRAAYMLFLRSDIAPYSPEQMASAKDKTIRLNVLAEDGQEVVFGTEIVAAPAIDRFDIETPRALPTCVTGTQCIGRVRLMERRGPSLVIYTHLRRDTTAEDPFLRYKVMPTRGGPVFLVKNVQVAPFNQIGGAR